MQGKSEKKRKKLLEILRILKLEFPDSRCSLNFSNPLELLIATILSAQSTDEMANKVTGRLFKKYSTPEEYSAVTQEELVSVVRSTGLFNQKSASIRKSCQKILEDFEGKVPDSMNDLIKLPGVGRKTANVILGNAFGIPCIAVDTHVKRLSGRLGLSNHKNPEKIERDLNILVPRDEWTGLSHLFIDHGRKYCKAKQPLCFPCPVNRLCPSRESLAGQK